MSQLENVIEKYRKKGFEVKQKRTLKYGKSMYLVKGKGGLSRLLGAVYGVYLYFVDGDSNPRNITEFLKEYSEFYDRENFDKGDRGIFVCSGKIDDELFRELIKSLVRDNEVASTIKTKSLAEEVVIKKGKKVIEEEQIKEKITEREITRRKVTEESISVRSLINRIRKFEPPRRPSNEKQLEDMLISNLQSFYDIKTQLTYERARIDAQIGKIGIEIKYQPSSSDFDRLYGQIEKYLNYLDYVIVVIACERSKELTDNFKGRLKMRGWLDKRVHVITK
jgi:hypothetical protein